MSRLLKLVLQVFGLLSSWFGAFQLGAVIKHSFRTTPSADVTNEKAVPVAVSGLRNEICDSTIEETERHQLSLSFDKVNAKDDDHLKKLLLHPSWAARILSYHCIDAADTGSRCSAILQGGGHLHVEWFSLYHRIDFEIFSGCGLLWKGADTQVTDVNDMVRMLTSLVYHTNDEHAVDELLMKAVRFSHQLRLYEFRQVDTSEWDNNVLHSDLGFFYLSAEGFHKKQVMTVTTDFQTVHIYDVKGYSKYQEQSDRILFLDGVIQSTSIGDSPYHEALVQPGMFTSKNPKRVAIIGGGEGATLREVLKHDTVEQVYMIEIDPIMVDACRKYLPQWNSCGHIEGSTPSCFDDPRAKIFYEDAMAWFINRFSGTTTDQICTADAQKDSSDDDDDDDDEEEVTCVAASAATVEPVEKFDVIIMDALDPQDNVGFADILYNSDIFFQSLFNALTDDGVLIMQLGIVAYLQDPPEEFTDSHNKANIVDKLSRNFGFQSVHEYQEPHCGFLDSWTFMVACKNARSCHKQWYSNAAYKQLEIRRRLRKPSDSSGSKASSLLKYIDGITLESYRVPSSSHEAMYCKSPNAPSDCWIGRPSSTNANYVIDNSIMNVQHDDGDLALIAKVDIAKGTYITGGGLAMEVERSTADLIQSAGNLSLAYNVFSPLLLSATSSSDSTTKYAGMISTGLPILFSLKNSSNYIPNVGSLTSYIVQEGLCGNEKGGECHKIAHNVVVDRHLSTYGADAFIALRNIKAGEVLMMSKS